MTTNQRKEFFNIWMGSNLFHSEFGLDKCDVSKKDIEELNKLKMKQVIHYIPKLPAFTNTEDIYKYVIKNFK